MIKRQLVFHRTNFSACAFTFMVLSPLSLIVPHRLSTLASRGTFRAWLEVRHKEVLEIDNGFVAEVLIMSFKFCYWGQSGVFSEQFGGASFGGIHDEETGIFPDITFL